MQQTLLVSVREFADYSKPTDLTDQCRPGSELLRFGLALVHLQLLWQVPRSCAALLEGLGQ